MTQTSKQLPTVEYEAEGQKIRLTPQIVQEYIVGSGGRITMPEFKFFTELCKARKLNPFLKEAYLIKYGDKNPAQMVVSKDVILKRAVLHPMYNGKESGLIVRDKETGEISERSGCFYDEYNEQLLGGWCKVFRKDWEHPEYMSVSLNEVAQKRSDGKLNQNWMYKTATMLEKVAKVRALREAFVEEFAGMYVEDELQEKADDHFEQDPLAGPIDIEPRPMNDESIDLSDL